jgi:hypothetical protein
MGLVVGWVIFLFGSNFVIGFSIGMFMSTVGLLMFIIHHRLMGRTASEPVGRMATAPQRDDSRSVGEYPR